MEDYTQVAKINKSIESDAALYVQPISCNIIRTPKCCLAKVILLDRTKRLGNNSSPIDEIELTSWLGYPSNVSSRTIKKIKAKFNSKNILIIKNLHRSLKTKTVYNVLPHPFSISYDVKKDIPKVIVSATSNEEDCNDEMIGPTSLSNYYNNFNFDLMDFKTIADMKSKGGIKKGAISVLGILYYKSSVDFQSKNPKINMMIEDNNGYKIIVSAFGECTKKLSSFSLKDIIYIRGCTLGTFCDASLTINDDTLVLVNPENNKHLSPHYIKLKKWIDEKESGVKRSGYNLSSYTPKEENDYVKREIGDIIDETNGLSEAFNTCKHQFSFEFLSIELDDNMWRFQCSHKNENNGMSCFRTTNLIPGGGWVCTKERPDKSLPTVTYLLGDHKESDSEKETRSHYGHVCEDVIIRMYGKANITDEYCEIPGGIPVFLKHEVIESLFGKPCEEIALMSEDERDYFLKQIISNKTTYYGKATSKYVPKKQNNYGNESSFEMNNIIRMDFIKPYDTNVMDYSDDE